MPPPPSDFDAAPGGLFPRNPDRGLEAFGARIGPATVCVAVHRLSNGGTLMRNAAAQEAFGPPRDIDTDDAFCAMFAEPDDGRRILALVGLGQFYQAEALLLTRQGARWHDVEVQLRHDPVTRERTVQFQAYDLGAMAASHSPSSHHGDPLPAPPGGIYPHGKPPD